LKIPDFTCFTCYASRPLSHEKTPLAPQKLVQIEPVARALFSKRQVPTSVNNDWFAVRQNRYSPRVAVHDQIPQLLRLIVITIF